MAEFWEAHNRLVDAHNKLENEIQMLSTKLADIEDRNRRNNVKIRGIELGSHSLYSTNDDDSS